MKTSLKNMKCMPILVLESQPMKLYMISHKNAPKVLFLKATTAAKAVQAWKKPIPKEGMSDFPSKDLKVVEVKSMDQMMKLLPDEFVISEETSWE